MVLDGGWDRDCGIVGLGLQLQLELELELELQDKMRALPRT
jgi:hypothetical protein